jgi:hypothetical protein
MNLPPLGESGSAALYIIALYIIPEALEPANYFRTVSISVYGFIFAGRQIDKKIASST